MVKGYRIKVDGKDFLIIRSTHKNKKYDVFTTAQIDDEHTIQKYITSFGDSRYEHYKDKLGEFSNLDHHDKKRRASYKKRSEGMGNLDDPYKANFWAYHILW